MPVVGVVPSSSFNLILRLGSAFAEALGAVPWRVVAIVFRIFVVAIERLEASQPKVGQPIVWCGILRPQRVVVMRQALVVRGFQDVDALPTAVHVGRNHRCDQRRRGTVGVRSVAQKPQKPQKPKKKKTVRTQRTPNTLAKDLPVLQQQTQDVRLAMRTRLGQGTVV